MFFDWIGVIVDNPWTGGANYQNHRNWAMSKIHIDEAIARIIGEDPTLHYLALPYTDNCGEEGCAIGSWHGYPRYSTDANAALRALAWLEIDSAKNEQYISIFPRGNYTYNLIVGEVFNWTDMLPLVICRAAISWAKDCFPDLMDYDNIDWGKND